MSNGNFPDLDLSEEFLSVDDPQSSDDNRGKEGAYGLKPNLWPIPELPEDRTEAEISKHHAAEVFEDEDQGCHDASLFDNEDQGPFNNPDGQRFNQGEETYSEDFATGSEAQERLGTYEDFSKNNKIIQDDPRFNQSHQEKENSWEPTPHKISLYGQVTPEKHPNGSKPDGRIQNDFATPKSAFPSRLAAPQTKNVSPVSGLRKSQIFSPDLSIVNKIMSTPQTVVNGRRMDRHSLKTNLEQQFCNVSAIPCQRLDDDLPGPSYNATAAHSTFGSMNESKMDRLIKIC
ncbi:unnamed protein product, partial [Mesorhabditis belari]|uniref:Uncharacterized protein n=1 Tax=Mesorhabditis belari TaxID=2138241 RepID=A0AAF3F3N3_9BILA